MPKGYLIGSVDVDDPEAYKAYVAETLHAYQKYNARLLVRGGQSTTVEGSFRTRIVVIEFPDYQTALECRNSPEYARAMALRQGIATVDCVVVEGCEG